VSSTIMKTLILSIFAIVFCSIYCCECFVCTSFCFPTRHSATSKGFNKNVKSTGKIKDTKGLTTVFAQSKTISNLEYSKNRFQALVQRLNLNDKQNQLFYDFCLSILSCLAGILTTLIVILGRRSISFLDGKFRSPRPVLFPLIGSAIVCIFYYLDNRVGSSPFTSEYHRNHFGGNSAIQFGGPFERDSPIRISSTHNNSNNNKNNLKDISIFKFSAIRQLARLLAVIVAIGSGCSLGFSGPAAEVGMSVSHVLGYFLPEYASKDRSAVTYITSPTTGEVSIQSANGLTSSYQMYDEVTSNYNANRKYYLILAGAGAGIAANFNAPFTGAMYSMEITKLLFLNQVNPSTSSNANNKPSSPANDVLDPSFNENDYRYLNINRGKSSALLLAVSAAALVVRGGLMVGSKKILDSNIDVQLIPSSIVEIPLFLALGVLGGWLSFVFSVMKQRLFKAFSVVPQTFRPLMGGLACAIAALIGSPQSLAVGYGTLNRILSGELHNPVLLSKFMIGKLVMVAISASSGLIGGQFAPSLFLGATFGALFYQFSVFMLPHIVIHNFTVYVLVGAASMIAGTFRFLTI